MGPYVLVMIYAPFTMLIATPQINLASCMVSAKASIGKELEVTVWDNMNGSNPIPKVTLAYCVEGHLQHIDLSKPIPGTEVK